MQWHSPGPEDDFYSYTREWTKAISRGGVFEVSNVAFLVFRKLNLLMRELLPPHLIKCTMDRAEVMKAVGDDEDLLFHWDILCGQLSNDESQKLLQEVVDLWMTISGHALAKQLMEQYKQDKLKLTSKTKSLCKELDKGTSSNTI